MRLLIIEDDHEAAHLLKLAFQDVGYSVELAFDGISGQILAETKSFDVMIVDRILPKEDGLSVLQKIRRKNKTIPVLILSALSQVDDRVLGLQAGGDDYLSKPYSFSELLARVEVLYRRRNLAENVSYKVADLELNRLSNTVERSGHEIILQPREFKLLEYLMCHVGQVVTRKMLLEKVWDYQFDPLTNIIDVHISRLRSKIDKNFSKSLLHTVRGQGYLLKD